MNCYPKICISPVIDSLSGGIRESLKETTMNLALAVVELYSSSLKYPDECFVEYVLADSCIGSVKEAAECDLKFETENDGLNLSLTSCLSYGLERINKSPRFLKVN